ncbi:MAG: MaoC family dehydratase [Kibdelosporangium sp.]
MSRSFGSVAELAGATGDDLGWSAWHQVGQDVITAFAEATGDHQWIHVDQERALGGPFGRTIAHGYYLLAVMPTLLGEIYRVDDVGSVINTGVDQLRFHRPVPAGSLIRAHARMASVRVSRRGVAQLTVEVALHVDGLAEPVCTALVHCMVRPGQPVATGSR